MKKITTTGGRIIFALPFAIFGVMHFAFAQAMQGMIPSFLPGGIFWVYASGAALIAAAVSFLINKQVQLSGMLLAAFLLIVVVTIHIPGLGNESIRQMAMSNMLKDLGLMGGALGFAGMANPKHTI